MDSTRTQNNNTHNNTLNCVVAEKEIIKQTKNNTDNKTATYTTTRNNKREAVTRNARQNQKGHMKDKKHTVINSNCQQKKPIKDKHKETTVATK